jgi:hypothetical protein
MFETFIEIISIRKKVQNIIINFIEKKKKKIPLNL